MNFLHVVQQIDIRVVSICCNDVVQKPNKNIVGFHHALLLFIIICWWIVMSCHFS